MALNLIPHTADPLTELLTRAAFAPIKNVGWIRISGEDRVRWLNGMVTNSIQALKPGEGCYCFFLNAQGRIQGDGTAWLGSDGDIHLQTAADRIPHLIEYLDRFIIMDDVLLTPLNDTGISVIGPRAPDLLGALGYSQLGDGLRLDLEHDGEDEGLLLHAHSPLVPRYEIWVLPTEAAGVLAALGSFDFSEGTAESLEALRILEGTPLFGTDIRDKDLPQETNQTRALHFSKGCYLGQEIVERIRSRGAVHRTFHGFVLSGDEASPGTSLFTTDPAKPVGELTSVARIGTTTLALGYIRREALDTKATIHYAGGTAEPTQLPYTHPTT